MMNNYDPFDDAINSYVPKLKVKKLYDNSIVPTRGSAKAAGVDLYAHLESDNIVIQPGETVMLGSGIACEFPEGYWGMVVPRSSIGIKRGLMLPNNCGVIDEDYRGEIMIAFTNVGITNQTIENGERVAQMILLPYVLHDIVETGELSDTERGAGGIGSTGKN